MYTTTRSIHTMSVMMMMMMMMNIQRIRCIRHEQHVVTMIHFTTTTTTTIAQVTIAFWDGLGRASGMQRWTTATTHGNGGFIIKRQELIGKGPRGFSRRHGDVFILYLMLWKRWTINLPEYKMEEVMGMYNDRKRVRTVLGYKVQHGTARLDERDE
jgi:hypothetical protein